MNIYHIFLIHSPVDGHLYCFCFLAIINNDAMIICVQVFMWKNIFSLVDPWE